MPTNSHAIDFLHLRRLPSRSLPIAAILLALALSAALPAGLVFVAGLAAVLGTGIGVAGLRRHGGPGVPALPFGASD